MSQITLLSGPERRRRWSDADKLRIVEAAFAPGACVADVARRFEVSDLVVGLVITSIGTSLPELAASFSAALAGSSGLVIGNVVGSNIANIGLVLGAAAIARPFTTQPRMHDRDGFILLASTLILFAAALDNRIGRLDAALFLVVYLAYIVFVSRSDREGVEHRFRDFLKFFFDFEYAAPVARRLTRRGAATRADRAGSAASATNERVQLGIELSIAAGSLAALVLSSRFVVREAVWAAERLELPENLIGLSLIAIGTSLPELVVSVSAARQGKAELVVGNIMGSNIANTLLIVGLGAVVHPLAVAEPSVVYTIPIMLFFSLALLYFVRSDWRISRGQGVLAVTSYLVFLLMAFSRDWG